MLIGAAARPDLPCTINQRNQGRELRRVTSAKQFEYLYAYYVRGLLMREIAAEQGVAITNYGVAIAHMHGILPRVVAPFGL